ncbi:MAG: GatB/YqeY domain-containing protein [Candidatus Brocadiaceae bacterium]|jgi:uncharacterized protein YqeY
MSIREQLAEHMKQALKAGQKDRLRVLRLLRAELQVAETSGQQFEEVDIVKSYANALRKSADEYEGLGRQEKAHELQRDLGIVEEFLPEQMDREELEELISRLVEENDYGPRDIGKVMKAIMGEYRDVVDGRLAQKIAREKLADRG